MARYSKEVHEFIKNNVKGRTCKELVELVNSVFDVEFTDSKMSSYKKNHKLQSELSCGGIVGRATDLYPQEIKDFINDNYIGVGSSSMAELLNDTFGKTYTKAQLKSYYANNKISSGLTGRFENGHKLINPFKKGHRASKATEFKKSQKSHNCVPIGSERINLEGYTKVKIQDGKLNENWKAKHIVIWEKYNGKVPEAHAVIFGDQDKGNTDIDNLLLVSRKQLLVMNRSNLIQPDTELTKLGIVISDLKIKINDRTKK